MCCLNSFLNASTSIKHSRASLDTDGQLEKGAKGPKPDLQEKESRLAKDSPFAHVVFQNRETTPIDHKISSDTFSTVWLRRRISAHVILCQRTHTRCAATYMTRWVLSLSDIGAITTTSRNLSRSSISRDYPGYASLDIGMTRAWVHS